MPRKCLLKAEKRVRVTDETFSKWRLQRDSLGFQYDDEYAQYLLRVGESLQKMNMLDQKEGGPTSADVDVESRTEVEPQDLNSPTELDTDMAQSGDEEKSDNDNPGAPGVTQTSIKAFKQTLAPPKEAKNNDSDYSARKLDLGWCTAEYDRQQVLSGIMDQKRFIAHLLNSHNQWCSTCRTSSATLTASNLAQDKSEFTASIPELNIPTSWESKKWFEDLNAHSNMSITSFLLHLLLIYSHWHSIPLPGGVNLPREVTMFARTADEEENVIAPYPTPELLKRVAQDILNRRCVESSDEGSEPLGCGLSVSSETGDVQDFIEGTSQLPDDTCQIADESDVRLNSEILVDFVDNVNQLDVANVSQDQGVFVKLEEPDDYQHEWWGDPGTNKIKQCEFGSRIHATLSQVRRIRSLGTPASGDSLEVSDRSFPDDVHMVTDDNPDSNGDSDPETWVVSQNSSDETLLGRLHTGGKEITTTLGASGNNNAKVLVACTTCFKLFPSNRALAEHRRVLKCQYCDFDVTPAMVTGSYGCVDVIKTHRRVCHPERYGFSNIQCRFCDFSLDPEMASNVDRCRVAMTAHVLESHPENAPSKPKIAVHKCEYCDFALGAELKRTPKQYRSQLATHKKENHPEMFEDASKLILESVCEPTETEMDRTIMEHLERDMELSENEMESAEPAQDLKPSSTGYYKCGHCEFTLNPKIKRQPRVKRAQLASHQREKHPELFKNMPKPTLYTLCKRTRCEYCDFALEPDADRTPRQTRDRLVYHKREKHPEVFPNLPPPSLPKKRKVDAQEKRRCPQPKAKKIQVDPEEKQICPICEKSIRSVRLRDHIAHHKRRAVCPYCDFTVDEETAKDTYQCRTIMFSHRKENHPEHFQRYLCDVCGRGLASRDGLAMHKVDVHGIENAAAKRKCPHCDEILPSLSKFKCHMINNHSENLPCTHSGCVKTFPNALSLKRHMIDVHAKTYDIACTFEGCTVKFSRKAHMERHVKQIHLKNQSFPCDFPDCGKRFKTAYNLRVHKRIHSQEKPLKCPHCDYRANQRNSMNWHLKKHAKGKGKPDTVYVN
ncbi:uncharacterized protein LOC135497363 isoform X2 [Lineus longissimus]|uniref:uncharacterized protein LOC135497363 isoform X2 n=1 Tax=Lineus longissimus TaxID=88925 RepID=UPI00315C77A2